MSRIARGWRSWVALLDRREPADALALMRILTGVGAFSATASVIAADVVGLLWLDAQHGGYLPIDNQSWLVALLGGPSPRVVWALVIISLVGAALVTVGIGGRVSPLVTAQAMLALKGVNGLQGSYGAITANALWLLVLSQATATLSVDCRLRTGRWTSDEPVPAWPQIVAIVQLAVIYFCNGLYKISAHWTPGGDMSAVYYILQQPTWQRSDMRWVAWIYPATQVGTALTWLFELSWPLVLLGPYFRRTADLPGRVRALMNKVDLRKVYLGIALVLHGLITLALDVGPFMVATLALYPCLFSSEELRAAARACRAPFRRALSPAS
jgi:hypothetical protein